MAASSRPSTTATRTSPPPSSSGAWREIDASIAGYLAALDSADRAEPEVAPLKKGHLQGKIAALKEQMRALKAVEEKLQAGPGSRKCR